MPVAYTEIARTEVALRDLVRLILGDGWGAQLDAETVQRIEQRRDEDRARRRGVRPGGDLLDYTELTQLARVIYRNWDQGFSAVIGPKRSHLERDLERLGAIRNAVAHTRTLLPFEEHLAAGIGGYLRNRIAIYRSEMNEAARYWPTLESVTDSFGSTRQGSGQWSGPETTIRVGDTVTFNCRATDPEGARLRWTFGTRSFSDESEGEDVTFAWTAAEQDVGESTYVSIRLYADRPHHRFDGASDGYVYFGYTVLPAE